MHIFRFYFISVIIMFFALNKKANGQTTFGNDNKSGLSKIPERKLTKHKVLVVPFEPRMYMSQIDHSINAETKLDQKKIKQSIRFGLDEEIHRSIKKKMEVISLLLSTKKICIKPILLFNTNLKKYLIKLTIRLQNQKKKKNMFKKVS